MTRLINMQIETQIFSRLRLTIPIWPTGWDWNRGFRHFYVISLDFTRSYLFSPTLTYDSYDWYGSNPALSRTKFLSRSMWLRFRLENIISLLFGDEMRLNLRKILCNVAPSDQSRSLFGYLTWRVRLKGCFPAFWRNFPRFHAFLAILAHPNVLLWWLIWFKLCTFRHTIILQGYLIEILLEPSNFFAVRGWNGIKSAEEI